ncbi:DUF547 domain-containing protein [Aurantivibrio plasticivorans]
MKQLQLISITLLSLMIQPVVWAESISHDPWSTLLAQHVKPVDNNRSTGVNYAGFAKHRAELKQYLRKLSSVSRKEFNAYSRDDQLAFLINTYNAWTVELILTRWPDLESIRDLGGLLSSPWSKEFIPLFGDTVSLDHIEHSLIRGSGAYNEPRIHFAVNCASIGCPALRAEAYTGQQLDAQLEEQTHAFLADTSRNRIAGGEVQLSSIFKWYRDDFEQGWLDYFSLEEFVAAYADALKLSPQQAKALENGDLDIEFLDYNWKLNQTNN